MIQVNLEKIPGGVRFKDENWDFSFQFLPQGYRPIGPDGYIDLELRDEIIILNFKDVSIDGIYYQNLNSWVSALYA